MTLIEILEHDFIKVGGISLNALQILLFFLTLIIGKFLFWFIKTQILRRFFQKVNDPGRQFAVTQFLKYFIYVLTFLFAIQQIGISLSVFWAGSAALLVGIGLGLQQTFNDLISGLILLIEHSVAVGDIVTVDGIVGRVRKIGLRTSDIETMDDIAIIIPNSKLVVDNVINWSYNGKYTRFNINVGVAYGSDVNQVRQVLLDIATARKEVLKNPPPQVQFINFGDSSLDFKLHFYTYEFWIIERLRSDLRFEIYNVFKEKGIEIPFPQRDLWIKNPGDMQPSEK